MQRALERYGDEEDDRAGGRLAKRIPASALSVADVAEVVHDQLRVQKREILQHIGRQLELLRIQQRDTAEAARSKNFHRRLVELESEVRELRGKIKR
jgi:hypothetical protein